MTEREIDHDREAWLRLSPRERYEAAVEALAAISSLFPKFDGPPRPGLLVIALQLHGAVRDAIADMETEE